MAPGMGGFLGILDPPVPVPHLQKLVSEMRCVPSDAVVAAARSEQKNGANSKGSTCLVFASSILNEEALKLSKWFCGRAGALLGRMSLQEKELSAVTEAWQRIAMDVEKLNRQAIVLCSVPATRKEINNMKRIQTASATRAQRVTSGDATWEEWISTAASRPDLSQVARVGTAQNGDLGALHEAISRLAYSYWEARGCQGGSAGEDWLRAEAEIRKTGTTVM